MAKRKHRLKVIKAPDPVLLHLIEQYRNAPAAAKAAAHRQYVDYVRGISAATRG